jgi:hypothetical protein
MIEVGCEDWLEGEQETDNDVDLYSVTQDRSMHWVQYVTYRVQV